MTEAEWLAFHHATHLVEFLRGKASDRKLRLLSCASVRIFWQYLDAAQLLVETFEDYADGLVPYSIVADHRTAVAELAPHLDSTTGVALDSCLELTRLAVNDSTAYQSCRSVVSEVGRVEIIALAVAGVKRGSALHRAAIHQMVIRGAAIVRDIFGNPFRPVAFDSAWRSDTAMSLARQMYESRDFSAMPILADALQDAGCDNDEVLNHCRGEGTHVRGCWVVDLVLGRS